MSNLNPNSRVNSDKKNVILFNVFLNTEWDYNYISFAHYALTTLYQVSSKECNFDVLLCLSSNDKSFNFNFSHLNQFNLVSDFSGFSNFRILKHDYNDENIDDIVYMCKWYSFEKAFELGYEKVFYCDSDVMFFQDPSYFFDKYDDEHFWTLFEPEWWVERLGYVTMNAGQCMVHRKLLEPIFSKKSKHPFFEACILKKKEMNKRAWKWLVNGDMTKESYLSFKYFNEQYCVQEVLMDNNITLKSFDRDEIDYGSDCVQIEDRRATDDLDGVPVFKNTPSTIWHYTRNFSCDEKFLPKKYYKFDGWC